MEQGIFMSLWSLLCYSICCEIELFWIMVMEHAGQTRLRLNLAETSLLNLWYPYSKQINSDRPELSPGAPDCCFWAPKYSRLHGSLMWAKHLMVWNHYPIWCTIHLKALQSSVQRPRQLCRADLLTFGLMPAMPDPGNSINNNTVGPGFPSSSSEFQELFLAWSRAGTDLLYATIRL